MSTTTHHLTTPPAPWSESFQSHLSTMPSPEFVLSTLSPTPSKTSSSKSKTSLPYLPRARFCIYRGMWSVLPDNKHNTAPQNPSTYTSDLPTFTTDVRMLKTLDIFATSPGRASPNHPEQYHGSGGGGPVEAVFWPKETGCQWRIRGAAYIVAPDVANTRGDQPGEVSSGVRALKAEVGRHMRVREGMDGTEGDWKWETELTGHFGNVSPGMRGTFRNPPPGQPTHGKEPEKGEELGQKVQDLEDAKARENFRVVVIVPEEVERTDLSDPTKARRMFWTFEEVADGKGEWKAEELWP